MSIVRDRLSVYKMKVGQFLYFISTIESRFLPEKPAFSKFRSSGRKLNRPCRYDKMKKNAEAKGEKRMKKPKDDKTNVMRVLDQKKIPYKERVFTEIPSTNGMEIAEILGEDPDRVFKTLVTQGKSGGYYVFVIPVSGSLDLKKAAKAVGEKAVSMIPQKELLPLTGYVHGGCSPIGMKKQFPTVLHESAENYETIYFSAGKVGYQVETAPGELKKLMKIISADVCEENGS